MENYSENVKQTLQNLSIRIDMLAAIPSNVPMINNLQNDIRIINENMEFYLESCRATTLDFTIRLAKEQLKME